MNFQQILLKIGIDGTAVNTGLGKVSAGVKAWGASMVQGLKSYGGNIMKGFIGAEAVTKAFDYLDRIKDKILTVARLSNETGANTNFIQSIMLEADKAGIPFENLTQGIAKFNKMLGQAKMGDTNAAKTLMDMGVATSVTNVRTLTFTSSMHNLAVAYSNLHDKQKQAYLLQQAFGRSYAEMTPIFERGVAAVDEMSGGNFFTRISSGAIGDFQTLWSSIKSGTNSTMATVANILDMPFKRIRKGAQAFGELTTGVLPYTKKWKEDMKSMDQIQEGIDNEKALQAAADKDGISVQEMKTRILTEQADLLEKQAELTSEIGDRDKESVNALAARARKLTGIKSPLEMSHTVTPRMRTALKISTLEDEAKLAWQQGNDAKSQKLQGEADQITKSSAWLKRADQNPMQKTEVELNKVNLQLESVKRMAEMVNSTKS